MVDVRQVARELSVRYVLEGNRYGLYLPAEAIGRIVRFPVGAKRWHGDALSS